MPARDSAGRFTGGGGGGVQIASIFAALGLKVDKGQWAQVDKSIDSAKVALGGLVAYFGARFLGKSLIGFNAGIEDAKNGIAGMLALSKKTNLSDELANADMLYANLQRRAASLPGTTQDYVQMLGALTQPLTQAGVSMQKLEDLSVNAVVASKALGVAWDVGARDIDQAVRGQFHSTDQLTGKLLGSMGYVGEEGRRRFNEMSESARVAAIDAALTQKQITQLAEAQGKTFSGRLSTLQDAAQQFFGRVGQSLFAALGSAIEGLTTWIGAHQEEINAFADAIGSALATAFEVVGAAVQWLIDHGDVVLAILTALGVILAGVAATALAAWIAVAAPVLAVVAALALISYAVIKVVKDLRSGSSKIVKALGAAWDGIKDGASAVWDFLKGLGRGIVDTFVAVGSAIAAPFIAAFDFILGAAKSTIQWIIDKVNWVQEKVDGFFAAGPEHAADFIGLEGQDRKDFIDSVSRGGTSTGSPPGRAIGAGGGGPISVAPANVKVEVNVNGGDPAAIEKHVRDGIGSWWEDQLANVEDAT